MWRSWASWGTSAGKDSVRGSQMPSPGGGGDRPKDVTVLLPKVILFSCSHITKG